MASRREIDADERLAIARAVNDPQTECRTDWPAVDSSKRLGPKQTRGSLDPHSKECGCEGCTEDIGHRLEQIAQEIVRLHGVRTMTEVNIMLLENQQRLLRIKVGQ